MKKINKYEQSGFTLIELMIALFLGLFITGIVITIFTSAKQSFRASTEISRSQENINFAMSFLTRNLRMAGYSSCTDGVSKRNFINTGSATYTPAIISGVSGWDFAGTAAVDFANAYDLVYDTVDTALPFTDTDVATVRASNAGAAGDWTNGDGDLPKAIADLLPMKGSDILVVSIATPLEAIRAEENFNQTVSTLDLVAVNGNPARSTIQTGQIVQIGDCAALDVFENQSGPTDTFISAGTANVSGDQAGNKVNASFRWQKPWDENTEIQTVRTVVYFVGTGTNGVPTLYSATSDCGINQACPNATVNALVDGVENMQILYGTGRDIDDRIGNITYESADTLNDFEPIANVKLSLLMRSPGKGKDLDDANTYTLLNNMVINPPDDRSLRFVNDVTINIGNKGS